MLILLSLGHYRLYRRIGGDETMAARYEGIRGRCVFNKRNVTRVWFNASCLCTILSSDSAIMLCLYHHTGSGKGFRIFLGLPLLHTIRRIHIENITSTTVRLRVESEK